MPFTRRKPAVERGRCPRIAEEGASLGMGDPGQFPTRRGERALPGPWRAGEEPHWGHGTVPAGWSTEEGYKGLLTTSRADSQPSPPAMLPPCLAKPVIQDLRQAPGQ